MKKLFSVLLMAGLLCFSITTLADGPPPPPGDPSSGGGGPVGAPIDGGLGILLAMGAAYGGRKLYKARKDKKESEKEEIATENQADLL